MSARPQAVHGRVERTSVAASSPWRDAGVAPRAAMHRRPNAAGVSPRAAMLLGSIALACLAPACGSSSISVSSATCAWTASSTAPWIKIAAGANGSGSGTVTLSVLPNGGEAREGRVTIAGQTLTVSQPALGAEVPAPAPAPAPNPNPSPAPGPTPCAFTLEPATQTIAAAGGSGSIAVTVSSGCTWSATASASWITITAGSNLQGNGTVSFVAAANSGAARSATIQVGTSTAKINQPAVSCSYTLTPAGT